MDDLKKLRAVLKGRVTRIANTISEAIRDKTPVEYVLLLTEDLSMVWNNLQEKHYEVAVKCGNAEEAEQEEWLTQVESRYNTIRREVLQYKTSKGNVSVSSRPIPAAPLKMERMSLPKFHGDPREYPRFKGDFNKFVVPSTHKDQLPFVLRRSLGEQPLRVIGPLDDDISEMWKRLDERYGDPIKLVDSILGSLEKYRPIKDGEERKFIEYVDSIERSHHDLEKAKLGHEMSNTRVVGEIERKLPPAVFGRWSRYMYDDVNKVERSNRLPDLLKFLWKERKSAEYSTNELRRPTSTSPNAQAPRTWVHTAEVNETRKKCLIHGAGQHDTEQCRGFQNKTVREKVELVKSSRACFCCLSEGHVVARCRKKKQCSTEGCSRLHHPTLHIPNQLNTTNANVPIRRETAIVSTINNHSLSDKDTCLLQLMAVHCGRTILNVLWDGCATSSLITHTAAKKNGVKGVPVKISITKVGGEEEEIDTYRYTIPLVDKQGIIVKVQAYGIDRITTAITPMNLTSLAKLFNDVKLKDIERPSGEVDVLIGFEYAGYHPIRLQSVGHLLLLENRFGRCLGGSHPSLSEETNVWRIGIHHTTTCRVEDFFDIESMGVECNPRCGSCKCGKCALGAKSYTLKEERELELIENNLKFCGDHWEAGYPWVKDPKNLPDNRKVAVAALRSLERRLERSPEKARIYDEQIKDMVERGVAREISKAELDSYNGPIHYIAHHAVEKPGSSSTPVRIVFNSSASFKGHVLNEYWAKGPDMVNPLLGVILRFRENQHAFVGDIKKMYHSVKTTLTDQHCHRFVWRCMKEVEPPTTYCVTAVNFGDRPSATIATVALKKTAEMGKTEYPKAAVTIQNNVYMDDILESVEKAEDAKRRTEEIDKLLKPGNFSIKRWTFSGEGTAHSVDWYASASEKVLGIIWDPREDELRFPANYNVQGEIPSLLTKRMCLSRVNAIYDPLGLITPVTVRAKILLRKLWGAKLGWDDPMTDSMRMEWLKFFADLRNIANISFCRCIKPVDTEPGTQPTLIIFSDASEQALGAVAYVRYQQRNGTYACQLIASKSRVAPLEIVSVVRLELSAAVLSKRLACYIKKEMRINFGRVFYLVDSEIVRSMIQKQSYGFRTFAATRIGEIQSATDSQDWWWISGNLNIADIISRGEVPDKLTKDSVWQTGPEFLRYPVEEWPIRQTCGEKNLPERIKVVMTVVKEEDSLAKRINVNRYSNFQKLLRVTARVCNLYAVRRLSGVGKELTANDLNKAETFWLIECQKPMVAMLKEDKPKFDKLYARLGTRVREDGIIVVGSRVRVYVDFTYNKQELPLLPYHHRFSRLYATYVHNNGHLGIQSTVSKIRSRYWIIDLQRMVKSIRHHCIPCRRYEKVTSGQQMGQLPVERLKPSPPWTYVGVDLFGPFTIRGEVNKRVKGKAYGVVFNCFVTRAIHIDLAVDYSACGFLHVLRRFVSLRGYPAEMYSDSGTQLVAASKSLEQAMNGWDINDLKQFGVSKGLSWKFSTADAPWQNGVTEILIKGIKKSIFHAIGEQILPYSELQTVMFEVANLANERPIGRQPTEPGDGTYLCPNDMLLGRSTPRVPSGPWKETTNPKHRVEFVQKLINAFWRKWTRDYFPSLIVRQKWHSEKRNLMKRDIVLVQDSNVVRGKWRIGLVNEVYPDASGKVRNVEIKLRNEDRAFNYIRRAAQRLVVLVPVDEQT